MSTPSLGTPPRHLTERERAIKAAILGMGLGVFLRLAARSR